MRIAIVANGSLKKNEFNKKELEKENIIICADGGANKITRLGITPNYLIGDMDSVSREILKKLRKKIKVVIDNDQDSTDLEKAIKYANSLNPNEVVILGAYGGSIDYTLANIWCLHQVKKGVECRIVDEKNELFLVDKSIDIGGKKGDIISVIPLTNIKGLCYKGLKWQLKNFGADFSWFGTRNRMISNKARISLKKGKIIVVKAKE
jgi:thiamine pyrophosphokinase